MPEVDEATVNAAEQRLLGKLFPEFKPDAPIAYVLDRLANHKAVSDVGIARLWESFGRDRDHYDMAMIDARRHINGLFADSQRSFTNALTHDKDMDVSTVDHRDVSYDRLVNVDEQVWAVLRLLINLSGEEKVREALWVILLGELGTDDTTAKAVVERVMKKAKK